MSKNFSFAAKEVASAEEQEEVKATFDIAPHPYEFTAYPPSSGQIALFSAAFGEDSTEADAMAAVTTIFKGMLGEADYKELRRLLNDRNSGVDLELAMQILEGLIAEFAANPTQPSSASSPSRGSGGTRSTASAPGRASTRSRSPRAASAT